MPPGIPDHPHAPMAQVRRLTIGFQLAGRGKLEKHDITVPASAIPATFDDPLRLLELPEVKRRFAAAAAVAFVEVSDPFDDEPVGFMIG